MNPLLTLTIFRRIGPSESISSQANPREHRYWAPLAVYLGRSYKTDSIFSWLTFSFRHWWRATRELPVLLFAEGSWIYPTERKVCSDAPRSPLWSSFGLAHRMYNCLWELPEDRRNLVPWCGYHLSESISFFHEPMMRKRKKGEMIWFRNEKWKRIALSTRIARQIALRSRSLIDISERFSILLCNPSMTLFKGRRSYCWHAWR